MEEVIVSSRRCGVEQCAMWPTSQTPGGSRYVVSPQVIYNNHINILLLLYIYIENNFFYNLFNYII